VAEDLKEACKGDYYIAIVREMELRVSDSVEVESRVIQKQVHERETKGCPCPTRACWKDAVVPR
jgi:hypothetical protein